MNHKFVIYFERTISMLLLFAVGFTPLFFLNLTTEFYEIPKLIFLTGITVILLGLWVLTWVLKGKVVITRTPLDLPLLILLAVVIGSTFFSSAQYVSLYGNFPRVHGSAVSWVVYILLYFVTVSHLRSVKRIKGFLYVIYGSGVLICVLTLMSFFKIYLPFNFTQFQNFTPTGMPFSTIAFLMILLPFPLLAIKEPIKHFPLPSAIAIASLFGITIILTGSLMSYIVLLITFFICLFVYSNERNKKYTGLFFVPILISTVVLFLAYFPLPGGMNKLYELEASFPKEVQLPFGVSWKVSLSAFRDTPFTGTGPSTYLFNFTTYKPIEFNGLSYWNFPFDVANNELLQILGTMGVFGVFGFVFFAAVVLNSGRKNLAWMDGNQTVLKEEDRSSRLVRSSMAVAAIISVMLMLVHVTTLISIVMTMFVLALFMGSQKSIREHVMEFSLSLKASSAGHRQLDLLPFVIFAVFLLGAGNVLFRLYSFAMADYYHRLGLSQVNISGNLTYQYLQRAEELNPFIDLYRIDMAQTNFALANQLATQKGPTEENPQGTLTDEDRNNIQVLLSQAINEGRTATALSPLSSRNWEVLAAIYRNISGVAQNALEFSLDSYGRAIQRDPLNPSLRINVGGIYYSINNFDLAIRFFTDAINLKPDYVNAYYNLAIAYRAKGDLSSAQLVAERTVALLDDKESGDYKQAIRLLDEIRNKASESEPPAAASSSALQNPELPSVEVENLDNPPDVTPAPSVRPNPRANIPQVTPAPTGGQVSPSASPTVSSGQ
jgi:tetratricopeptide (TPR) repeat protein